MMEFAGSRGSSARDILPIKVALYFVTAIYFSYFIKTVAKLSLPGGIGCR